MCNFVRNDSASGVLGRAVRCAPSVGKKAPSGTHRTARPHPSHAAGLQRNAPPAFSPRASSFQPRGKFPQSVSRRLLTATSFQLRGKCPGERFDRYCRRHRFRGGGWARAARPDGRPGPGPTSDTNRCGFRGRESLYCRTVEAISGPRTKHHQDQWPARKTRPRPGTPMAKKRISRRSWPGVRFTPLDWQALPV